MVIVVNKDQGVQGVEAGYFWKVSSRVSGFFICGNAL